MDLAEPGEGVAAAARPLHHESRVLPLLGIAAGNAALTVVTLTVYRFWARARVRRWLWSRTTLYGEPLEYTGTGGELFRGFLKAALLVFLPLVLYGTGVQYLFPPEPATGDAPLEALAALLPVYLLVPYLYGQAIFRARRYRLSRTLWRGVRPGLEGSPHRFALGFLLESALAAVTLGWSWPRLQWRTQGGLWRATRLGDRSFALSGGVGPLYGPFAAYWCAGAMAMACLAGGLLLLHFGSGTAGLDTGRSGLLRTLGGLLIAVGVAEILVCALLYAWYRARFMAHLADSLAFDDLRFAFRVSAGALIGLLLGNVLVMLATLGLGGPLVQRRNLRFAADRLAAVGVPDIDAIRRGALERPASGEGLADAFDLDAL